MRRAADGGRGTGLDSSVLNIVAFLSGTEECSSTKLKAEGPGTQLLLGVICVYEEREVGREVQALCVHATHDSLGLEKKC